MENNGAEEDPKGVKALVSYYSNYLWNQLASIIPSSDSNFLRRIPKLSRQTAHRRCCACLPLPLPKSSMEENNLAGINDVLDGMMGQILLNLHRVEENLQFWQSRAEFSNSRKLYFIFFERGPRALIDVTAQCLSKAPSMKHICEYASSYMHERVAVLSILRRSLATFLAKFYMEVERCGEELVKNPKRSLPSFLTAINGFILDLEASIGHIHANPQTNSSVDGSYSMPLVFEKLPELNQEDTNWSDCEIADGVKLVNKNLHILHSFLFLVVAKHQKPKKVTQYWIRYTCGTIGLSVCSMWLLRHSRVMGSSDINNWIRGTKDSIVSFFSEYVEQPLLSLRDELLDTFRKTREGMVEIEQLQLTADSLERMLSTFNEETKGQKFPENTSEREMLEIVMAKYEKESMNPIQNLLRGELALALCIQVEKITLDSLTLVHKLDQIMKANEINFAVLAVLPAFFLSHILLMAVRAVFKRDTKAWGRSRIAKRKSKLILVEIEMKIMEYQSFFDKGLEKESHFMFGLVLYNLDLLSHAVRWDAQKTGEWERNSLMHDIIDLGTSSLETTNKLKITSGMNIYDYECLGLPSSTRNLSFLSIK